MVMAAACGGGSETATTTGSTEVPTTSAPTTEATDPPATTTGSAGRDPSLAFMLTSLVFNIVPMLCESGYTTAEAVAAYAVIGPAQLAGRIAVVTLERFISLTAGGLIGTLFPRWP